MRLEEEARIARTSAIHGPLHVAKDGNNVEDSLELDEISNY